MSGSVASLRAAISGSVDEGPSIEGTYGRDASHLRGRPIAVARPSDAPDVERLVRWARAARVPLVARGGGTSLDGESVPRDGAVVVDLAAWDRVLEIDVDDRLARVGPGVVNRELARALAPHGLFFPPNPGSWTTSTLGGNLATNASGPRSFKYGSCRRWVAGMEVVLGTGARLTLGGRTTKRSVGPDLLSLFVGSEGILGITTEATLHLAVRPARRAALVVPLRPDGPVGPLARAIARWPTDRLSAVEYLDLECAAALHAEAPSRLPSGSPLLLLEFESPDEAEESRLLERVLGWLGDLRVPGDPLAVPDADELWTLRGRSGLALDRSLGERIREDVAVPLSRLDEMVREVARIAAAYRVRVPTFGHVGDGNLHPNFAIDPTAPAAAELRRDLLASARRLGGTISAEHGVGALKAPHLGLELGPPALELLRSVKAACDPDGILNPGKVLPP